MIKKTILKIYTLYQRYSGYKYFGDNTLIHPWWSRIWNKECISIRDNTSIWRRTSLLVSKSYNDIMYSPKLFIGNNVCVWNDLFIACIDKITIEDNVLFSDRVFITDHIHGYDKIDQPILTQDLEKRGPVHIKEWAFIGINAVILPGVTIGKNSVVWASSVVVKDVPDYCVVSWNPAKILKMYDHIQQKRIKPL